MKRTSLTINDITKAERDFLRSYSKCSHDWMPLEWKYNHFRPGGAYSTSKKPTYLLGSKILEIVICSKCLEKRDLS